METFSALLAICAGNSPVPDEFPAQRPVTRSFDIFFDLRLDKRWINNREAGDLRRYFAHCDVTVMDTLKALGKIDWYNTKPKDSTVCTILMMFVDYSSSSILLLLLL